MTHEFKRENGEVLILSEKELDSLYIPARIVWLKDYIVDMLIWKGFDADSLTDEKIEEIVVAFIKTMTDGDELGELEAEAFDSTMENDFPEMKKEEDEDED